MPDNERMLVSRLLHKPEEHTVIADKQVSATYFVDPASQEAFAWIREFFAKHTAIPSLDKFEEKFPDYRVAYAKDPLSSYVDDLLVNFVRNTGSEVLIRHASTLITDPMRAIEELRGDLSKLELVMNPAQDLVLNDTVDEAMADYEKVENMTGIDGYAFPWERLNDATWGLHAGEAMAVVGRPETGKTWVLVKIGAHLIGQDLTIVLNTREMPKAQMRRRLYAVYFQLPYSDFRKGKLEPAEKKRYFEGLKTHMAKLKHKVVITECRTVDALMIKAKQYNAQVILADGAYLMTPAARFSNLFEQATYVSRELKQMLLNLGIPGIATWQFNRGIDIRKNEGGLEHIGLSDAVGQDNDIVTGLFVNKDLELNRKRLLRMLKVREAEKSDILIDWILSRGPQCMKFSQVEDEQAANAPLPGANEDEPLDF